MKQSHCRRPRKHCHLYVVQENGLNCSAALLALSLSRVLTISDTVVSALNRHNLRPRGPAIVPLIHKFAEFHAYVYAQSVTSESVKNPLQGMSADISTAETYVIPPTLGEIWKLMTQRILQKLKSKAQGMYHPKVTADYSLGVVVKQRFVESVSFDLEEPSKKVRNNEAVQLFFDSVVRVCWVVLIVERAVISISLVRQSLSCAQLSAVSLQLMAVPRPGSTRANNLMPWCRGRNSKKTKLNM